MEQRPLRVDLHTNLGVVPRSANKSSQEIYVSPQVLADFLNKFNITHNIVLYSDYDELVELDRLTPNTKLYGLKWINDIDLIMENPVENLDIGKPLWAGVKFHSHRTYRKNKEGEIEYGLDYSDTHLIGKILEQLPDNSIINMHTQGSASLKNQATPRAVYTHAMNFPNLKFIISHMGAYGKGSYDPVPKYYPSIRKSEQSQEQKQYQSMRRVFHFAEMLVRDAVYIANRIENVFLNTSILYPLKRIPLQHTDQWGIGSDFPFTHTTPQNWDEHSYDVQIQLANNYVGEEKQKQSHVKSLEWINLDVCKEPKKKWVALFSRTGNEIDNLSLRLDRYPDIIITTKTPEQWRNLKLSIDFDGEVIFIQKNIKTKEYIELFESLGINPGHDVITLHGFLKIIPARVVNRYPMVNLHPGLITEYPELKGLDPQKRAFEDKDTYSRYGCVLHKVSKEVDEGEVIAEKGAIFSLCSSEEEYYKDLSDIALSLWEHYLKINLDICELESPVQAE